MIEMSNSIYKKNANALKNKHPNMLNNFKTISLAGNKTEIVNSRDHNYSMIFKKENISMYLHSRFRPIEEAKKWASDRELRNKVIIILGFGLSYYAKEVIQATNSTQNIIIIEPSHNIFYETIKHIDCTEIILNDRVHLFIGANREELYHFLSSAIGYVEEKDISMYTLPNYEKLFCQENHQLKATMKEVLLEKKLGKNTIINFSKQWQVNMFNNLRYILTSHYVKSFFAAFKDKPAIIVAAGPSLDKNIQYLLKAKNKAVIISVDTALPVLLKNNIKPDLAVTVDGGYANYSHFRDIDYSGIPIVYDARAYYGILEGHGGEKILSTPSDGYIKDLLGSWGLEVGDLLGDHTVASNAFELAVKLEADPIIFVGQDLSYKDYIQTHAQGAVQSIKSSSEKGEIVIKDIYGNDVLTNVTFYASIKWFEKRIALDKSSRIYIDATEGGAKIQGTKIMTLEETIEKHCQYNINTENTLGEIFTQRTVHIEKIEKLIEEYKKTLKKMQDLKANCLEAEALSEALYQIYYNNNLTKIKKINNIITKLDIIDKKISREKGRLHIINFILQPVLAKSLELNSHIEDASCSERDKGMRIALASKELYLGILKAIEDTELLLTNCTEELEEIFLIKTLKFTVNVV